MTMLVSMNIIAQAPLRPMLEQGKEWFYYHHHFEATDDASRDDGFQHTLTLVSFRLEGETEIDGRTYMKMYRYSHPYLDDITYTEGEGTYQGAYREEDGRVYVYGYGGEEKDFLLIDFSMQGYDAGQKLQPVENTIKTWRGDFRRYKYRYTDGSGQTHTSDIIGVEGVGFNKTGLVNYVFEPQDCGLDYDEFFCVMMSGNDFPFFSAQNFNAPKEIPLTADEHQLLKANNHFAFNLFSEARENKNMLLSPLSITYALGMMNNGAAGQTQEEINNMLGFAEGGCQSINNFCRKLIDEIPDVDEQTKMLFSNTIFVNQGLGYTLQDDFEEKAFRFYDATLQARNFSDGQTLNVINQWASDHTEGMIQKILSEEEFNESNVSYLLNALYFKGPWANPFEETYTQDEDFNGQETVSMMYKSLEKASLVENDLYRAAVIDYGNGGYTMTVFLPNEGKCIDDVLKALSNGEWPVSPNQGYDYVNLKMPKFETQTDQPLKQIMQKLGMTKAFNSYEAEFPYFCNTPIYIDMMKQSAKIKVDEQGTEAAAVTIIGSNTIGIPSYTNFYLNRPFLYIISEQSTNAILFIGQFVGEHPTGIKNLNDQISSSCGRVQDGLLYNLQGQRFSQPSARGIYIKDGRKYRAYLRNQNQ